MSNTFTAEEPPYFRAALSHQYNLILVGGAACLSLAFASWVPLALGLVVEALWLLVGPRLDGFRRYVDEKAQQAVVARNSLVLQQAVDGLHPGYAGRIGALEQEAQEIHMLVADWPGTADQQREVMLRLEPLLRLFLELCSSQERLRRFIASTHKSELEGEVQTLSHSLSNETDFEVRVSMRRALSLAERRIKQLESIDTSSRAIEMRMQTIEKSFAYLKSCAVSMSSWDQLFSEIESITAQLRSTGTPEADTDELHFTSMHEGLREPH